MRGSSREISEVRAVDATLIGFRDASKVVASR